MRLTSNILKECGMFIFSVLFVLCPVILVLFVFLMSELGSSNIKFF